MQSGYWRHRPGVYFFYMTYNADTESVEVRFDYIVKTLSYNFFVKSNVRH